MSSYSDASLVLIPSGYKTSKVYCAKPTDGTGDLTFTRSNDTATRVNSDGLIEKVRTNLLLQSNTFSTTWAFSGTGTVTTGVTDPFGGTTAWTLAKTTANTFRYQSTAGITGSTTFSIYAKAGTIDQLWLNHDQGGSFSSYFDLTLGTAISATGCVATIVSVGGGWYRCSIAGTSVTPNNIRIYPASGGSISGTTGNILIYAAQAETGDIATDYIATTTASVSVGPVANLPRLDYTDSTCPKLLLEPQRTNLVTYSESFDNTNSWTRSRTSAFGSGSVANAVTSPDGYTNAEYIQQAAGETDGGGVYTGIAYTSGTTYTLSVFAKQGDNRYARIGFGIGSGGDGIFCGFDLQDGIAGTPGTGVTAKIENYGNGWYRCSVTATAQITGVRNTFVYQSSNLNTFVTTPLQGIYVYGAQLESSASYATSYIPTIAASTRAVDSCYKTGISSLIGQTEGTLFVEFDIDSAVNTEGYIFRIDTTNFNDNIYIVRVNTASLTMALRSGGSTVASSSTSSISGRNKAAIAYKSGSLAFYINGTQVGTSAATYTNGITYDDIRIGGFSAGAANMAGTINQALLFTTRLTNAQLAELTSL